MDLQSVTISDVETQEISDKNKTGDMDDGNDTTKGSF